MAATLPYLGQTDSDATYSIENDVKQIGLLMQELLGDNEDEDFTPLIREITQENKHERPSLKKCISQLEELLCL
jgi:hypothetical protein